MKDLSAAAKRFIVSGMFIIALCSFFRVGAQDDLPDPAALPVRNDLPDPFTMMDGTKITTPEQWRTMRRSELKKLFQHYMYGYFPVDFDLDMEEVKEDPSALGGAATYREVMLSLSFPGGKSFSFRFSLFIPNAAEKPVPVFVAYHYCPIQTLTSYEGVTWSDVSSHGPKDRGSMAGLWEIDNTISRGFAIAAVNSEEVVYDRPDAASRSITGQVDYAPGGPDTKMATITGWAFGLHRVVDYIHTVPEELDTNRICVWGWSRTGKTALWTGAMDERIDLVIPHQSGTGGMATSRGNPDESVESINSNFPHWFNGNFKKFNNNENRLPFDQHCLAALVAPRPLIDIAGIQDTWAAWDLAFETLKAAAPVWELLGEEGIIGTGWGEGTVPESVGRLYQFRLNTGHTVNVNYWNAYMDFAEIQFANPVTSAGGNGRGIRRHMPYTILEASDVTEIRLYALNGAFAGSAKPNQAHFSQACFLRRFPSLASGVYIFSTNGRKPAFALPVISR